MMTGPETATATCHDDRPCFLGEGPLWHPRRQQLFWFDIINCRLRSQQDGQPLEWQFGERFSAAGWVDEARLLLASETGLWLFAIDSGTLSKLVEIEAGRPETRSNDGRADPHGGFWIGTMGKAAEMGAGAIWRYYRGQLRQLHAGLQIPNAICFSPDGRLAYFSDTNRQHVFRQPLDGNGWPAGPAQLFLDLGGDGVYPDGAVTDAEGAIWNAQWGAGRVARYLPDGRFDRALPVPGRHSSCPAFGGPDLDVLYVTTAQEGMDKPDAAQGLVYALRPGVRGREEPQVRLE